MINQKVLCSCIYCRKEFSVKGIYTHVDRAHLDSTKYSSGYNGKYKELANRHKITQDAYLLDPNKCTQCNSSLAYNKRNNKFCSTSCSATYNNAIKDYSKFKTGPVKTRQLKHRKCEFCNTDFTTYKDKRFCNRKCARDYKNFLSRSHRTPWINYRAECQFRFNIKDYPDEFDFALITQFGWYKASNRGNNLTGVSRDHMVSCRFGFDNQIPAEHIRHPANCKLMIHTENASKRTNNSITYNELLDRIKRWEKKYPPSFDQSTK